MQNPTFGLFHFVRNDGHCEEERRSNLRYARSLLSHFANHTHLVAASIDRAVSIDELHNAQRSLTHLVQSLTTKGVRGSVCL